jgi:hypothetical protein
MQRERIPDSAELPPDVGAGDKEVSAHQIEATTGGSERAYAELCAAWLAYDGSPGTAKRVNLALGMLGIAIGTPGVPPAEAPYYTYASTQATNCARCGKHKHTPLRVDGMDGYVCLTCIDKELERLLDAELGYSEQDVADACGEIGIPDPLCERLLIALDDQQQRQRKREAA